MKVLAVKNLKLTVGRVQLKELDAVVEGVGIEDSHPVKGTVDATDKAKDGLLDARRDNI